MYHPIHFRPQRLLSFLVCMAFIATASTNLFGQRVIQRTYPALQRPSRITPIYPPRTAPVIQSQAPIQNRRIIYGQPIPTQNRRIISSRPIPIQNGPIINGRIINGQPIPLQSGRIINNQSIPIQSNRIINGPIISGPVTNGSIIGGPIIQSGTIITPQIIPQPKSVVVDVGTGDQDVEINRLNAEIKRLEAFISSNGKQSEAVERLQRELYKARLDLSEMQKSAVVKLDDNSATTALNEKIKQQQKEIDRLKAIYQKAFQSNEALTSQIKLLTDQRSRLKAQLAELNKPNDDLVANAMEIEQLRSNLSASSNAFNKIKQKNAAMTTEYNRLRGEFNRLRNLNKSVNTDNANLNSRIDELSMKNQRLAAQFNEHTDVDNANANTKLIPVVAAEKPVARTSLAADQGSATFNLKRKNYQLVALNEKVNQENELLDRRIAELEGSADSPTIDGDLSIDDDDRAIATSRIAATFDDGFYNLTSPADAPERKYNVMRWLIPFLAIGLTIGLYVFLTEEHQGTSRALIAGGDLRDDRERKHRS